MYIMQSEREALERMVCSFADEHGLTVRTRDLNAEGWAFSFYKKEREITPKLFIVKWDGVTNIYTAFKVIEENVLHSNAGLNTVRIGKAVSDGFIDGVKGNKITIKDVMFKPPATVVFWSDGSKTVVKTQKDDKYDPEKGLAMAISKRFLGNSGRYYNVFDKWLEKAPKPIPIIPGNIVYHQDVIPPMQVGSDGKIDGPWIRKMLGRWKNL